MHIPTTCSHIPKKKTHGAISNKIIRSRTYSPCLENQKPDWLFKSLFIHHWQISYFPNKPIIAKLLPLLIQRHVIRIYSSCSFKIRQNENCCKCKSQLFNSNSSSDAVLMSMTNENEHPTRLLKGRNQISPIRSNVFLLNTQLTWFARIVISVTCDYDTSI